MNNLLSKYLTLNQRQWLKGISLSVLGTALTAIYTGLSSGIVPLTLLALKPSLIAGVASGVSYVIHSLTENSNGVPFGGEPKAAAPAPKV